MWPRRAGALILCCLAAHGAAHAEGPKNSAPVGEERGAGAGRSEDVDAGAAASAIIITSFSDDQFANPVEDGRRPAPPAGPVDEAPPRRWTDHVASDRYSSVGSRIAAIKWESLGVFAFYAAINAPKFWEPRKSFHFKQEGWFGQSTDSLGVDKLAHAYDTYILAELLHARLHQKTGAAEGDATTAALVASSAMIFSEIFDGIEENSGFSIEDVVMNTSGAAFSLLRNVVPGVRETLDFRLLLTPNSDFYTRTGRDHWAQQQYLLALKLSGFERFENSPLRFVELQTGYRVSDFTYKAIARGGNSKGHVYFGVGFNLRELFFKGAKSTAGRVAGTVLNYLQLPYTAIQHDY